MFIPDPAPTFKATVLVVPPGEDDATPWPLPVVFKHRTRSAMVDLLRNAPGRAHEDVVLDMVESIPDLPDGQNLAGFVAELVEKYPSAPAQIIRAYGAALTEARAKN